MGQDPSQVGPAVDEERTPEELRREIAQTRAELGETAAALAAKTDVKAQAKAKVEEVKQTATEKKESLKQAAADKKEAVTSGGDGQATRAGLTQRANAVAAQARTKAQEKPTLTAAAAAFFGGYLVGRRRSS